MTKQLQATMAAILVMSTISVRAQLSTTTQTTKTSPSTTKTTVVTTDRSASKSTTAKKRSTTKRRTTKKAPVESATTRQLRELRELMVSQQAQLDALKQQNADKDAKLATAQADATAANASAQQAAQQAQTLQESITANQTKVDTISSDLSDMKLQTTGLANTIVSTTRDLNEKIESPTTIHYKGVTITPVAFFALEGVYRTRSINSDVNTPFNTTPFPGSNQAHVSEFNFSGRQSRLGALITGDAGPFKLSGYFESDFLSAGATSNANQSNSYTFRQRQIWGQAATKSGFAVTGGQMWSLVTENGKGTDNRTEKLPNTIDAQYQVGFNWARQPAIRLQQKLGNPVFGSAVTLAVALENAQIQSFSATGAAPTNFFFAGPGQGGGLYNVAGNYANNVAPDTIAKIAFDFPHSHFEVGGLARFFRDRYYPLNLNPLTGAVVSFSPNAQNDTKVGGGAFGSARVSVNKYVDIAAQGMWGQGTGRYGTSQLADATVHPDGRLEPIRNYHGLFSIESHPTKKLDVYGYYGAEYAQRTLYRTAAGTIEGYAAPSTNVSGCFVYTPPAAATGISNTGGNPAANNCTAPTRVVQEGTVGFTYRVVNSPKYGRLQYQATYSYLSRTAWSGLYSGTFNTPSQVLRDANANNNMIFTGMRYYIP